MLRKSRKRMRVYIEMLIMLIACTGGQVYLGLTVWHNYYDGVIYWIGLSCFTLSFGFVCEMIDLIRMEIEERKQKE